MKLRTLTTAAVVVLALASLAHAGREPPTVDLTEDFGFALNYLWEMFRDRVTYLGMTGWSAIFAWGVTLGAVGLVALWGVWVVFKLSYRLGSRLERAV